MILGEELIETSRPNCREIDYRYFLSYSTHKSPWSWLTNNITRLFSIDDNYLVMNAFIDLYLVVILFYAMSNQVSIYRSIVERRVCPWHPSLLLRIYIYIETYIEGNYSLGRTITTSIYCHPMEKKKFSC